MLAEQEQEGAHSYDYSLAMRRDGESNRDRQGGRGLAWLVKSLVFMLKAKRSPERFQEDDRHC